MADAELYRGRQKVTVQQAKIVDSILANRLEAGHRITVVDAGAGSGKTYTTVAAVLELLDKVPQTSLDQFVLITFTRKAAEELKQRLESALLKRQQDAGSDDERRRWANARERLASAYVGTIHGFCRRLLRAFGHGAMVARESDVDVSGQGLLYEAISDTLEEQIEAEPNHPLLSELGRSYQSYHLEALVREIYQDIRNRGLEPADISAQTEAQGDDAGKPARVAAAKLVVKVHEAYARLKLEGQRVDAADLLSKTAAVLEGARESEPAILAKIAARYRWLFVDEFQDTNRMQERLVESLLPHLAGVLLVGDVKQSIYAFRGAGLDLQEIAKRHHVDTLPLSMSRRPTLQLLQLQNRLFQSVGARYPGLHSPLQPSEAPIDARGSLPALGYVDCGADLSAANGARATAELIRKLVSNSPPIHVKPGVTRPLEAGDIAVLFRANWAMASYEQSLNHHLAGTVAVRRDEGGQFFRQPEIIAAYRLFRLVLDYPNDIVISQALRTPYLHEAHPGAPERKVLQHGRLGDADLAKWLAQSHRALEDGVRDLQAAIRTDTAPELLEGIYLRFGLREYHQRRGERNAIDNLERLREMARTLTESEQSLTARVFVRWLQGRLLSGFDEPDAADVASFIIAEPGAEPPRPAYVRLMTVHKAKGLEFPIVIIPEIHAALVSAGGNDARFVIGDFGLDLMLHLSAGQTGSGQFAGRTKVDESAQRREAMRIFYVAVTRARNAVLFIGAGDFAKARPMQDPKYSWKDEIIRAWADLLPLGAVRRDYSANGGGGRGVIGNDIL